MLRHGNVGTVGHKGTERLGFGFMGTPGHGDMGALGHGDIGTEEYGDIGT